MARNRQRAKERQARRKAGQPGSARTGGGAQPAAAPQTPDTGPAEVRDEPARDGEVVRDEEQVRDVEEVREEVNLEVGAPPEDLGRSDEVLDDEPLLGDDEHFDPAADHPEEDLVPTSGPKGHRGRSEVADHKDRPRFVQFLFAVRAELARVQWPDRQALTTLTGVVLGFVLIAGGYLGLLDAIFSRLIQAIL
jgi:preprotein translocase SecE subunit